MILLETLLQDLRYAARTLLRTAGFTTVSVFALALGIGVNTAVFTVYKAFIARPLDAHDPSTMVNFSLRLQSGGNNAHSAIRITKLIGTVFVPSAASSPLISTSCA